MARRINLESRQATGERRRARTREKLLRSAIECIADKGWGASIDDITQRAGVSRGSYYNFFPKSGDLADTLLEELARISAQRMAELRLNRSDPAELVALDQHYRLRLIEIDPVATWLATHYHNTDPVYAPLVERSYVQVVKAGIDAGRFRAVNPEAAVALLLGSTIYAQRMIMAGVLAPEQLVVDVATMQLETLGLGHDEAVKISREIRASVNRMSVTGAWSRLYA